MHFKSGGNWRGGYQHKCHNNFEGLSGSMDANNGLLNIFERSVEQYGLRYLEFLGDGDSKAHKLLVEQAVYGDVEVETLECVGHLQKRLGSRLRSLKKRLEKNRLEDGKPSGGKGRLTDKIIDKLQNTQSVDAMQNAIMAV